MNTIPSLSPETIEIIRDELASRKEIALSTFRQFRPFFHDEDAEKSVKAHVNSFCRALDEFNAAYPEEEKIAPTTPRPTDKDIERIRYELDRAIAIADNVNDHISLIRRYPNLGPFPELFFAEIAALLRSVSNARAEFNAAFPEEARK